MQRPEFQEGPSAFLSLSEAGEKGQGGPCLVGLSSGLDAPRSAVLILKAAMLSPNGSVNSPSSGDPITCCIPSAQGVRVSKDPNGLSSRLALSPHPVPGSLIIPPRQSCPPLPHCTAHWALLGPSRPCIALFHAPSPPTAPLWAA